MKVRNEIKEMYKSLIRKELEKDNMNKIVIKKSAYKGYVIFYNNRIIGCIYSFKEMYAVLNIINNVVEATK